MILPGHVVLAKRVVTRLQCAATQVQPCGIDLTLKNVSVFTTPATIDFDNSRRRISDKASLEFQAPTHAEERNLPPSLLLTKGVYMVEFNEHVKVPDDIMGQIFVRSSLWRSGASLHTGVVDAGYSGVLGAMLKVENEHGICVFQNARLAQIVFSRLTETTAGYSGQYQGHSVM